MSQIAALIARAIAGRDAERPGIAEEVADLVARFPAYTRPSYAQDRTPADSC